MPTEIGKIAREGREEVELCSGIAASYAEQGRDLLKPIPYKSQAGSNLPAQIIHHRLHLCGSMRIAGLSCGSESRCETLFGFVRSVELQQQLRRHLIGRNVLRRVLGDRCVLCKCRVTLTLHGERHRQTVAGKWVGGVLRENLSKGLRSVHSCGMQRAASRSRLHP